MTALLGSDPTTGAVVGFVALVGLLGLLVGSFLNVVVHRVPAGLSVVHPPSACPGCGHQVRGYDNVPVLSWLLLRGRCRDCRLPIPVRYPLVEAATAAAFAFTAWRVTDPLLLAAALVVVPAGIALALIDLEHHRLPFAITRVTGAGLVLVVLVGALTRSLPAGTAAWPGLGSASVATSIVVSVLAWTVLYAALHYGSGGRAMGLGDVALAPVLGLLLGLVGWPAAVVGLFAGFVVGACVMVPIRLAGRVGPAAAVPHGPFMLAGAAVGLFAGMPLAAGYLSTFGMA